jgi:hypothetical protein
MHFIKALVKDVIEQSWTLLGMAVAWLVLEGSAKDLTGNLIGLTLLLWIITFPFFRYEKEEKEPKDGDKDGYVFDGTSKQRKVSKKK